MPSMTREVPTSDLLAGFSDNKSVRDALRWLTRRYGRTKLRKALEWVLTLEATGHDEVLAALVEAWQQIYGNPPRGGMAKLAIVLVQVRKSQ